MRSPILFTTAMLLVTGACASVAPEPAFTPLRPGAKTALTGIVQEAEGFARLPGTILHLAVVGRPNEPFASAVADEHGNFAFAELDPGIYLLRIGRPKFTEQRMRVQVTGLELKPLDIRLRAVRGERCIPSRYHTLDCP